MHGHKDGERKGFPHLSYDDSGLLSEWSFLLCVCVTVKHDCSVFGAVTHLYSHRKQITASTDSLHVRELKASDWRGGGVFDELSKESRKMLYCKIM